MFSLTGNLLAQTLEIVTQLTRLYLLPLATKSRLLIRSTYTVHQHGLSFNPATTSRVLKASMLFDDGVFSSNNFFAVTPPATGTRYSTCFPTASSLSFGRGYAKGKYSGSKPNCRSTVPWSQEMCSWHRRSPRSATTEVKGSSSFLFVGGMPGRLESS